MTRKGKPMVPKPMLALVAVGIYVALTELLLRKPKKRRRRKASNKGATVTRNLKAFEHLMSKLYDAACQDADYLEGASTGRVKIAEMSASEEEE
ncbi:hypothetical protein BXZ70DRAFT_560897 [Cristinia sonorae]|uniref:Uncharacterized protein n=1 Tax=Cristinia sonorae TaxID=1940300 RepID=A0A8K0UFG9_9AGAR|nr:hypothetical protein BXZ70DRAFT_560897 [Cristinia sonorae]